MEAKPRHMYHEAPFTPTPGLAFIRRFCVKCLETKPSNGGRVVGGARLFVCAECGAKRAAAKEAA